MKVRKRVRFAVATLAGWALVLAVFCLYESSPSSFLKAVIPPEPMSRVVLSGRENRGRVIDLQGGWFNEGRVTELVIRSERFGDGWERPDGLILRNGRLRGSIRIVGLGRNGEDERVRRSSLFPGHTGRAQAAAPSGIVISGLEIEAHQRIPVYLAPGVTKVTIENCRFTGWSVATAIYLDAESARNAVRGNTFELRTYREVIAVDGSADNRIEGNLFRRPARGGVYLYRNCGEGGTIRHQTPHGNGISGNQFDTRWLGWRCYGIWIGSRGGRRSYCGQDDGYPFGSSADDRDFAESNLVQGNIFDPAHSRAVRDDGAENQVSL